ncbi:MAG: GNAT family N-acetyltransferase, partial [Candidatus Nanopelagicales bacterium]
NDPDLDPQVTSELIVFGVDPSHRRHGHGSRLLTATAESLASSNIGVATVWLNSSDDASRKFLESAGWGADGAHRRLARDEQDPAELQLRQIRMGTDLSADTTSAANTTQPPDET